MLARSLFRPLFIASIVLWTFAEVPSASATPIVHLDASGNATGISDLLVGGVLYDVDFVWNTQANVYGGVFDFTTAAGAKNAVNAIVAALNAVLPIPSLVVDDTAKPPHGSAFFDVVYAFDGKTGQYPSYTSSFVAPSWPLASQINRTAKTTMIANFSTVPEPTTALLLGSGMLSLVFYGRRKNA